MQKYMAIVLQAESSQLQRVQLESGIDYKKRPSAEVTYTKEIRMWEVSELEQNLVDWTNCLNEHLVYIPSCIFILVTNEHYLCNYDDFVFSQILICA